MSPSVAVIGGGYGGIAVAADLDDVADVILIEPRDAFQHNVAALRGLVDPAWVDKIFMPYDRMLRRGRVLHERAVRVDSTTVDLSSATSLQPDYLVLATGSHYPFPAKSAITDSDLAKRQIRAAHASVQQSDHVLILGAGPVGLELAGEIKSAWPDKEVTIVDRSADILSGRFLPELRSEVRRQLDDLGIRLLLGTSVVDPPASEPGATGTFSVTTTTGETITADIWFRCFGVTRSSDYLAGNLTTARQSDGSVAVTERMNLPGHHHVFAIGDLTAIPETKLAKAAGDHAGVVAANIRSLIAGDEPSATYAAPPPGISLPLGPDGGVSYSEEHGLLNAEVTSQIKGVGLRVAFYQDLLGLIPKAA